MPQIPQGASSFQRFGSSSAITKNYAGGFKCLVESFLAGTKHIKYAERYIKYAEEQGSR